MGDDGADPWTSGARSGGGRARHLAVLHGQELLRLLKRTGERAGNGTKETGWMLEIDLMLDIGFTLDSRWIQPHAGY
jgi:hypothetical protein